VNARTGAKIDKRLAQCLPAFVGAGVAATNDLPVTFVMPDLRKPSTQTSDLAGIVLAAQSRSPVTDATAVETLRGEAGGRIAPAAAAAAKSHRTARTHANGPR
jgi:hypothetical protein